MKLTRKHYNRKVLSFGLILFIAVALLSTGFAAWIMSTGAEANDGGNVSIGAVTEGKLTITELAWTSDINLISFDAEANDLQGEIKWDEENAANLTVEITGKVSPKEYLDDLRIVMEIPQSVKDAADAGYIELPDCAVVKDNVQDDSGVLLVDAGLAQDGDTFSATKSPSEDYWTFKCTITFKWGSKFDGKNPSIYLDELHDLDDDGEEDDAYSYNDKRNIMIAFKRSIYGFSADSQDANYKSDSDALAHEANLDFSVTIFATAK